MKLQEITHITFDCYGTLIDWESGILNALQPWFEANNHPASPQEVLRAFVDHEARLEGTSWRPYREILREVTALIGRDFGITPADPDLLSKSIPQWKPFPDTVPALLALQKHFKLAILSNIDDELFAETRPQLQASFTEVITAEQLKSYNPAPAHFQEALRRFGVKPSQILHVAQSLYHDHVPAKQLGIRTAWIDRPSLLSLGLAPDASVQPDITVSGLSVFIQILRDLKRL
jgi:2-haloacid dehalogenase